MKTFRFTIFGRPVPKPRMTRRDIWDRRPCILKYREWQNKVLAAAISAGGASKLEGPLRFSAGFFLKGHPNMDLDNLCKGILDSLIPHRGAVLWTIPDDSIKIIPQYGPIFAAVGVPQEEERAEITLEEIR